MEKEIYIIRHGETALNAAGIVQGRGIDSDLNDVGRSQAEAFYQHYQHIAFDKLYTSTLKRTHQTTKRFIEAGLAWEQLAGLDELAWGEWEGRSATEHSRAVFRDIVEQWQAGNYDAKFKAGESPAEVRIRLQEAMDYICSKPDEHRILICMHGRAMRLLFCMLTGRPLSDMVDFPHLNTTLYRFRYVDGKFEILDFNNTDHLK
jgi:probable phosphoglycerate mutase